MRVRECWRSFSGIGAACSYVSGAHWRCGIEELGLHNAGLILFVRVFWRLGVEQEAAGICRSRGEEFGMGGFFFS